MADERAISRDEMIAGIPEFINGIVADALKSSAGVAFMQNMATLTPEIQRVILRGVMCDVVDRVRRQING